MKRVRVSIWSRAARMLQNEGYPVVAASENTVTFVIPATKEEREIWKETSRILAAEFVKSFHAAESRNRK
jgi:hypothetical protein